MERAGSNRLKADVKRATFILFLFKDALLHKTPSLFKRVKIVNE